MKMSAHVRFYYGSIYTGTENGMDFIILSTPLNNVEQQQGVIALLLYQAQTVTPLQKKSIETVNPLFYIKVFYCTVPVRGSLLHGHVTAITK